MTYTDMPEPNLDPDYSLRALTAREPEPEDDEYGIILLADGYGVRWSRSRSIIARFPTLAEAEDYMAACQRGEC